MGEWLLLQQGVPAYSIVFLMLLGGAVGLPIPEDLPLVLSGVLIHVGKVVPEVLLLVCYVGVVVGDLIIFACGRALGPALFQKSWFRKRFTHSRVRRVRYNLERRSLLMILIARHLFYLRTATFLICGAVRMRPYRFIIADCFAALISIPVMVGLGYLAAEHIDALLNGITKTKHILFVISLVLIVAFVWYRVKKAQEKEDEEDAQVCPEEGQQEPHS